MFVASGVAGVGFVFSAIFMYDIDMFEDFVTEEYDFCFDFFKEINFAKSIKF